MLDLNSDKEFLNCDFKGSDVPLINNWLYLMLITQGEESIHSLCYKESNLPNFND